LSRRDPEDRLLDELLDAPADDPLRLELEADHARRLPAVDAGTMCPILFVLHIGCGAQAIGVTEVGHRGKP
jgi:hypothetical protein